MIKPPQYFSDLPLRLIAIGCALQFSALAAPPPPAGDPCSLPGVPCPDQYDPPSCDDGSGGGNDCSSCAQPLVAGLPRYWVSEPWINTRLEDVPLWYNPARGKQVAFHISYRQRGSVELDSSIFGLGPNWSCSFRSFVISVGGSPEGLRVHNGGSGWLIYTNGATQYRDGSVLTSVTGGGYRITYPDGSTNTFTDAFTDGSTIYYFITSQSDPAGNTTTYTYSTTPGIAQLVSVTDPDGLVTQLYYQDTSYPNQITKVVDPFSRTVTLTYDDTSGYLTNIVDVQGLHSSFNYDPNNPGWIIGLTTPYGATSFSYSGADENSSTMSTGNNTINRSALVTLPSGGNDLYLFRQDCSSFISTTYSPVPSTTPLGNTLDNVDQENRNSFHWDPLQYTGLSTTNPTNFTSSDYLLGKLSHWLTNAAIASSPSDTVSVQRQPSQTYGTAGQLIWYDYSGKTSGNNYVGTNAQPSLIALVLPDGTTRYSHYNRNQYSKVTQDISTYTKTDLTVGQRTNTFAFAANNIDLAQQIGPNGEQVVSNYFNNSFHEPNASYDALNQQTVYTYNSYGQLTSVQWPTGLTTTNIYFTASVSTGTTNRLADSYDFSSSQNYHSNAFTYANGLVQTVTDERGVTLTKYWDNLQRLTGVVYPDSTAISNIYTILDVTGTKDRLGNWTYSGYDSTRHKIAETNANNVVTRYGYCECGALTSRTNAWNTTVQQVITYSYDYQGNPVYIYFPDITVTNWFNAVGQLYQRGDERGLRYFYFNNQGLQTNTSSAYGTEQSTIFDIEDRPLYVTDANGVTMTNTFDVLGRVLTHGYPDGGVEKFGYSVLGLVAYTNQINLATYYAYDAAERKTFETNANNGLTQFKYDASGNLTNLIDPKVHSTFWAYDSYNRVTNKAINSGTIVLKYTYDADDRLASRWSLAMGTTYYTNDAVGNLTYIKYPAGTTRVSLSYDALDRVTTMLDAAGTTTYSYTAGNQVFTESQPFNSSTLTNTYVNRLRTALSLQQPTGVWTNAFAYDAAARMTNVTSPAGSFAYTVGAANAASRLIKKIALPNTSYITNTYDTVARLSGTYLYNSGNSVLDSAKYGYNLASQRTAFTNAAGTYVQYTYDKVGQVTIATSSVTSENRGYAYDAAWNLNYNTNNGSVGTFSVNSLNELTADPNSSSDAYDGDGNLTSRNSGSETYTYDGEDRLTDVTETTTFNSGFTYDGLGRLRQRIEYTWTGMGWAANKTFNYLYDGMRVIQERDVNNNPTTSYTRGPDLSSTMEGAGGIGGLLGRSIGYSSGNWTTNYFYHADAGGNITYLVDSSQAMAASYRYDPFGNTLSSSGSQASLNLYRFSSKEINTDTGMYYFGYRFYDPSLLRWINRDPIQEDGGINLYEFVYNNPLRYSDRDGLVPDGFNPPPKGLPIHYPLPPNPKPKRPPKPPQNPPTNIIVWTPGNIFFTPRPAPPFPCPTNFDAPGVHNFWPYQLQLPVPGATNPPSGTNPPLLSIPLLLPISGPTNPPNGETNKIP